MARVFLLVCVALILATAAVEARTRLFDHDDDDDNNSSSKKGSWGGKSKLKDSVSSFFDDDDEVDKPKKNSKVARPADDDEPADSRKARRSRDGEEEEPKADKGSKRAGSSKQGSGRQDDDNEGDKNDSGKKADDGDDNTADKGASDSSGALGLHNSYRARHGVPALSWSSSIASKAQAYANKCSFSHSGNGLGENLAQGHSSWSAAIKAWYNEESQYNYNNAAFSSGTGHFTQMVWRSTTQLGCGVASCGGSPLYVCNYSPAGNVLGRFKENVPRPGSS